jgi:alanine-synthesizing transaminase
MEFKRINQLPPYVFSIVNEMKIAARRRGEDIIDLGMGNPDLPTPPPIVEKLIEAARNPRNHRYSASKGIPKLREAICSWYLRRYGVMLNPDTEAVVTIGSKEGIAHLALATIDHGDKVLVPNPTYPIHAFSFTLAGAQVFPFPMRPDRDAWADFHDALERMGGYPKAVLLCYPHNPTTLTVQDGFFEKVVSLAHERGFFVIHDLAYADITFGDYKAPSFLSVPGAREIGAEFFTLSKSYNMPGWRVGFLVGNSQIVGALTRLKSYLDYGMFQPIQIASILALNQMDDVPQQISRVYEKRCHVLVEGLTRGGWAVTMPKGSMFLWAQIPSAYRSMGSLEFSKLLMAEAQVGVSPGIGFGTEGDEYVRFALVENENRIRQATMNIKRFLSRTEKAGVG